LDAVRALDGREFSGRIVHLRLDRVLLENQDKSSNVYIGNIPWTLTDQDMCEKFQGYNYQHCNVLTNMYGKSRGFALVKFDNISEAEKLITDFNQTELNGRIIEVFL
jgi:RNA recognition motif-containing protein